MGKGGFLPFSTFYNTTCWVAVSHLPTSPLGSVDSAQITARANQGQQERDALQKQMGHWT